MRREDEAEFSEFVEVNLASLRKFGYLVCGDWHRAEDAVQTVLTKLYLQWRKVDRRAPIAYAQRMVVNALNDVHRRAWFRREQLKNELPEHAVVIEGEAASDRRLMVLAALAQLPTRRRATLVLRFWADRTVDETADIMGCSPATVKSQTSRALATLRGLLPHPMHEYMEGVTQ